MKQEERQKVKELLLNTLKDGLPYGLQLKVTDIDGFTFNGELLVLSKNWCRLDITDAVKKARVKNQTIPLNYIYIKPYLRSMSSMTEEEKDTYDRLIICNAPWEVNDWLNVNHFDYRGLIPMGLAIEVTKENNPYEFGIKTN